MSFKIQTLNKIASVGLNQLDRDNYEIASEINNPDAILVRSAEMHDMQLSLYVLQKCTTCSFLTM